MEYMDGGSLDLVFKKERFQIGKMFLAGSVADPDPYVFGPPLDPDPDPFVRVMDPDPKPSIIKQKNNLFFVGVLRFNDENSRIRIRIRIRIHYSESWICGSGSTPKCHGSATLGGRRYGGGGLKVSVHKIFLCFQASSRLCVHYSRLIFLFGNVFLRNQSGRIPEKYLGKITYAVLR
jgi:hypothetical protein